jgi:hypothetical protein
VMTRDLMATLTPSGITSSSIFWMSLILRGGLSE